MRRKMHYLFFIIFSGLLIGCGHKNPMITDEVIQHFKNNLFLDMEGFPIKQCADYYSGFNSDQKFKTACDKWSSEQYTSQKQAGNVPDNATIEDFRDPAFWKRVLPH